MKIKISALILLLLIVVNVNAQSGKTILDNASRAYNGAGVITATFTIETEDVKAKTTYSQDGKAYLKGDKFKIELVDGITWFDGTTQWVYVKASDEVNISTPTGEELATVSPAILLNTYKSGFKLNNKGELKENGKTVYSVEMVPESKKSEFSKMVVNIDKTTSLFTSIKMYGKNGMNSRLIVKNLKTNTTVPDNTFIFNKKDYPKAEVIDLR